MRAWDKLKHDLTQHRGKAAVLGVLFAAMVALSVRAALELRPRAASAASATPAYPEGALNDAKEDPTSADAAAKIQLGNTLWHQLREVKATALDAKSAFAFDASHYPAPLLPPSPPTPLATAEARPVIPEPAAAGPMPVVEEAAAKAARIREQARALVVKSTAVGNGTVEPMAIINQQLATVGQKILGFEITAIRAREVEFVKEGVTTVVKMPEGQ